MLTYVYLYIVKYINQIKSFSKRKKKIVFKHYFYCRYRSNVSLPFHFMNKKTKWRHCSHIFLHIFPLILIPLFFGKTESVNHCEPHQFQCKNGNCVLGATICNDIMDCSDGSDEVDCGM